MEVKPLFSIRTRGRYKYGSEEEAKEAQKKQFKEHRQTQKYKDYQKEYYRKKKEELEEYRRLKQGVPNSPAPNIVEVSPINYPSSPAPRIVSFSYPLLTDNKFFPGLPVVPKI